MHRCSLTFAQPFQERGSVSIPAEMLFYIVPLCGLIVPREPVRTTLRFAPSAPLRFAPSGVRSGTHSWPNVPYEGEPLFSYSKLTGIGPSRGIRQGGKADT